METKITTSAEGAANAPSARTNNTAAAAAYDTYKSRGHIRSASLENANSFILKNTLGLPIIAPGHAGTLKSRNEQKRLKNRFGSHSNLDDYVAQSKSKFQNLRNMFETKMEAEASAQAQPQHPSPQQATTAMHQTVHPSPLQSQFNAAMNAKLQNQLIPNKYDSHAHAHNHAQSGQGTPQQVAQPQQPMIYQQYATQQRQPAAHHQRTPSSKSMHSNQTTPLMLSHHGLSSSNNNHNHHHQHYQQHHAIPLQHQHQLQPQLIEFNENLNIIEDRLAAINMTNAAGLHITPVQQLQPSSSLSEANTNDQAKNLLRPIAFKPIPFEPDYSIPNRYSDLCDRYGSTPSLAPIQGPNMKFGSTTDLRHGGYNSYCSNLMARRRCSRSLKINDSMESVIRHTPDSDANSQSSTIKSSVNKFNHNINHNHHLHHQQDQFDMTPSPSDSGISELEAALKDRDSELSYLRQTMEHNEKVIFKVHKDKEVYWEQETKRLKAFYESQQREYLMKIKKMEQMLTLQSFQFKQNKLRISENSNRIKEQFSDLKNENDILRNESEGLKTTEKTMRDRVLQLEEKISVMDKLILNLKAQLEENEWTVCERNGEIALLKTQLKEAKMELTMKDHEIVNIKTEHQEEMQNHNETVTNTGNSEFENKINAEISQLNRIIILKDQVILALTNELGKLRKELSDLAIFHEYGEEPSGKYTRLKYKIENLSGICNQNVNTTHAATDDFAEHLTDNQSNLSDDNCLQTEKFVRKALEEDDLEVIINCLKSTGALSDTTTTFNEHDSIVINTTNKTNGSSKKSNLPDVTRNFLSQEQIKNSINHAQQSQQQQQQKRNETEALKRELDEARQAFETEKQEWAAEKEKVLAYQKQLQMHYINMYQKMKDLENKLSQRC